MSKTLIGIVTFGNLPFTQLAVRGIRETVTKPYELFVVVGDPSDWETQRWLSSQQIEHRLHPENLGFPASVNDIYDQAWKHRAGFDHVIIAGNDIVPYPDAIDEMIALADGSDWEWIAASQVDARSICERYVEARTYFAGESLIFTDFGAQPWKLHDPALAADRAARPDAIEEHCIKDVRNLCLFTRSVFDKIGYADVNFWPGGYFEDNDYCTRALRAKLRCCGLPRAAYFHFWSRTIHQGSGREANDVHFAMNAAYYTAKWGGPFAQEKWELPFNGEPAPEIGGRQPAGLRISSRVAEPAVIKYWRGRR